MARIGIERCIGAYYETFSKSFTALQDSVPGGGVSMLFLRKRRFHGEADQKGLMSL